MTGDNLRISIRAIYFAHYPVDGIGGGQDSVVLTVLRACHFVQSNFLLAQW